MMGEQPADQLLTQFVDFLLPILTPYEATIYLYLVRKSHLRNASPQVRVGKRTISADCGQARRAARGNYEQITKVVKALEAKDCISIGDTTRDGTLYTVRLPCDVPAARERIVTLEAGGQPGDYYRDPDLRKKLFERDAWKCRYCGEQVSVDNATLDHRQPVSQGGEDSPENLVTCCLLCNSVKSGKTYEEAAPALLASIRERRLRT
jgi:hypothetical protein